ncbi:MAG TPA: thioredoxin family protein [Thermoplasmatales archaeon]|nr:thioredoxin family protein [Thermoplasmatales archaeon]
MKIEVLGSGCAKCKLLEKRVKEAIKEMGKKDVEIVKIESVEEIMKRGIMVTPGLAIDGEAKIAGRVPSIEEIKELIKE